MGNHYNCIYMYTNLITGRRYVGKAKDFNARHKQHLIKNELLIDKRIKEYGIENFKIEILIENVQDNDKLNEYEKFFIKRKRSHISYGTGYNRTWGGDGGLSGGDTWNGMTEEQRLKRSRKQSKTMSKTMKDSWGDEDFKEKRSKAIVKACQDEDYRKKMSKIMKGKNAGGNNPTARSVICLEIKQAFDTVKQASEWCHGNVSHYLKGKSKYAGKHPITGIKLHWQYYDEYLKLQEEEQQNNDNLDTNNKIA